MPRTKQIRWDWNFTDRKTASIWIRMMDFSRALALTREQPHITMDTVTDKIIGVLPPNDLKKLTRLLNEYQKTTTND